MNISEGTEINGFIFKQIIGYGGTSVVWRATLNQTAQECAIKVISKTVKKSITNNDLLMNEIRILKQLKCRSLLKFIDYFNDKYNSYIVTEFCQGMSLHTFINSNGRLPERVAGQIMSGIVEGVAYLHSNNIAHRDLKLENIIIDTITLRIKILDFGLAITYADEKPIKSFVGSLSYAAPEILMNEPYNPMKADVWALGVIYYALIEGRLPWDITTEKSQLQSILYHEISIPSGCSQRSAEFLKQTLNKDPSIRASVFAISKLISYLPTLKCTAIELKPIARYHTTGRSNYCNKFSSRFMAATRIAIYK